MVKKLDNQHMFLLIALVFSLIFNAVLVVLLLHKKEKYDDTLRHHPIQSLQTKWNKLKTAYCDMVKALKTANNALNGVGNLLCNAKATYQPGEAEQKLKQLENQICGSVWPQYYKIEQEIEKIKSDMNLNICP